MNQEQFFFIFIGIFTFFIILSLFKSLVRAVAITIIFILLFKVGWVYDSNDLKNKLHVDKFIKSEYAEDFYDRYDDYNKKRESGVLDTQKMDKEINNKLNNYNYKHAKQQK